MAAKFPLTARAAPAAWARYEHEIEANTLAAIATMRLSDARRRVRTDYVPGVGAGPDDRYVRESLRLEFELQEVGDVGILAL